MRLSISIYSQLFHIVVTTYKSLLVRNFETAIVVCVLSMTLQ